MALGRRRPRISDSNMLSPQFGNLSFLGGPGFGSPALMPHFNHLFPQPGFGGLGSGGIHPIGPAPAMPGFAGSPGQPLLPNVPLRATGFGSPSSGFGVPFGTPNSPMPNLPMRYPLMFAGQMPLGSLGAPMRQPY